MRTPRVLCVGLSCLDHVWQVSAWPPQASRTHAEDYRLQGGGPASTAAVTVARLGGFGELWAIHGDDPGGGYALQELRGYGVAVDHLRVVPGATTFVSAVLVEPSGERHIFPFRGRGLLDSVDGLPLDRVAGFGAVLIDGRHPQVCAAAVEAALRAGVPTLGDFGDARHWHLTEQLDYLLVSEECATEVLGRDDPEAALAALRRHPRQLVGITLGPEGFLYDDGERVRHVPALAVEVVDTNGAGDVFHGAYAYAVASGWTSGRCALFASVTAALSCTGLGRSAIPTSAEVKHLLEERTAREMDEMRWT